MSHKKKHTSNEEESMLWSLTGIQWPKHFEHGYEFHSEVTKCCRPLKRGRHGRLDHETID
jgi:hypothetical protein